MTKLHDGSAREIVSTRIFEAPREIVFKMWADPNHLATWWGPKGFSNTFHEFDPRPGGNWRFVMHGPDGREYRNHSVIIEFDPPQKIVFVHLSGPRFHVTVTFEELQGKTSLLWRMLFENAAEFDSVKGYAIEGNRENLDKLEAYLASIAAT